MADVSGNTLLMAIQAVRDATKALEARIADGSGDPLDDVEMLMSYSRAADELRGAYEVARLNTDNLPSYEDLLAEE